MGGRRGVGREGWAGGRAHASRSTDTGARSQGGHRSGAWRTEEVGRHVGLAGRARRRRRGRGRNWVRRSPVLVLRCAAERRVQPSGAARPSGAAMRRGLQAERGAWREQQPGEREQHGWRGARLARAAHGCFDISSDARHLDRVCGKITITKLSMSLRRASDYL